MFPQENLEISMTSEKTEVSRWTPGTGHLNQLALMHRTLGRMSNVSDYLIYEDANFVPYLASALAALDRHAYFYDSRFGVDSGFCHIIVNGDSLFLNNIFVNPHYHGRGVGTQLLARSLKFLSAASYKSIELDIFASNAKAQGWYEKMGFAPRRQTAWRVFGQPTAPNSRHGVSLKPDISGFQQIYVGRQHVGSRINERAVLTDGQYATQMGHDFFRSIIIKQDPVFPPLLQSELVETSTRFTAPTANVLSYLSEKETK